MAGKEERKRKIREEQARRDAAGGNGKSNGIEASQAEKSAEEILDKTKEVLNKSDAQPDEVIQQISEVAGVLKESATEEEKQILNKVIGSAGLLDQVRAFLTGKKGDKANEPIPTEPEKKTETREEPTKAEVKAETKKPEQKPTEPKEEDGDDFLLHLEERIVNLENGHKENIEQAAKAMSEVIAELRVEFAKVKSTAAMVVNETTNAAMKKSFLDFEKNFRVVWEPRFVEVLQKVQEARTDAAKAEAAMSDIKNYLPLLRQMASVKDDLTKMEALRDEIVSARDTIMAALGKPIQQETKSTGLFG
jgi:hypothetical protein